MPLLPHKNQLRGLHIVLLIGAFLLSRAIIYYIGIRFDYSPLASYWQYPDVEILRHNLVHGLWYQSAQPPLFNLLLGILLKAAPGYPSVIFAITLMTISLVNALLLYKITVMVSDNAVLPLVITLVYMLAPATMLLENELFYTSFVSMLFLGSGYFLTKWYLSRNLIHCFFFFLCIAMICFTKSFYHLAWMAVVVLLLLIKFFPTISPRKLLLAATFPLFLVTGWYVKNYILFGTFSSTSWTGMNLARLVFHDSSIDENSSIAGIPPFYPISSYAKYYTQHPGGLEGINDKVLKSEFKQGRDINMFNEQYLEISRLYIKEARHEIAKHPGDYLKNVAKAWLIYFTPASSYFKIRENEKKIKYYDALGSLNVSSFFEEKVMQKKSLVVSSLVMIFLFALTITFFIRKSRYPQRISPLNYFILITVFYSILVSSFFEYGDNMRFRYEIQPLFLILLAQYLQVLIKARRRTV